MTSTSAVRDALADLADAAPAVDVPSITDSAVRGARSRRVRRRVVAPVTAVALGVLAWSAIGTPFDLDTDPAAPAGSGGGYDPNIETPWPRLHDLPMRVDEPLALTYTVLGSDQRVVSRTGEQWELPDGHSWVTPSIAPDGRKVVWYDASDQELIVRDLAAGSERRIPATFSGEAGTVAIAPDFPVLWSPDSGQLALTSTREMVSIVDVGTGAVTVASGTAQAVGWRDEDTVVGLARDPGALFTDLVDVTTDGSIVAVGTLQLDGFDDFPSPLAVSPDGGTLAGLLLTDGAAYFEAWDIGPNACAWCLRGQPLALSSFPQRLSVSAAQPPPQWLSATELLVSVPSGSHEVFEAVDTHTGAVRPLVALSPRLGAVELNVVPSVVAAGPSEPLHTDRWWGWYVDRIVYGAGFALLVALLGLVAVRRPRHAARRASDQTRRLRSTPRRKV